MNESKNNAENLAKAIAAVLLKKQQGKLINVKHKNNLSSQLRHQITDLRGLNGDVSGAAIAAELTLEGYPTSASTVQRVLRQDRPGKRKQATAPPPRQTALPVSPPPAEPPAEPTPIPSTCAEELLKKLQQENGLSTEAKIKTIASLKAKSQKYE